jgi:hypothetical protein
MAIETYGVAFEFCVGLVDRSNRPQFKASPTIAAGDFKVSTDGGAFTNLATLPDVYPSLSKSVRIRLSAGEMTGEKVVVVGSDAAGAEWDDVFICLTPEPVNRKAEVAAYASGMTPLQPTVSGRTLDVSSTGEAGIDWANVGSPTTTVGLTGTTISTTQAVASVASVTALGATAKADVNAEVVDALATDTYAEPSGVPSATASLKDKIGWMQALARNKITQTATTQTLRNDGDSGNVSQSTVSDDGTTFTRGKFA